MALHKVKKPFGWYPDGFTREALEIGDERDFGSVAAGLVGIGNIEPVSAKSAVAPVAIKPDAADKPAPELAPKPAPAAAPVVREHKSRGRPRK